MLANDANPASRKGPWEPSPRNIRDVGFSASRAPAQLPRADVTLENMYATACTKRLGFDSATDCGCVVGRTRFTPAVHGGILSLIKDSLLLDQCEVVPIAAFFIRLPLDEGFRLDLAEVAIASEPFPAIASTSVRFSISTSASGAIKIRPTVPRSVIRSTPFDRKLNARL